MIKFIMKVSAMGDDRMQTFDRTMIKKSLAMSKGITSKAAYDSQPLNNPSPQCFEK